MIETNEITSRDRWLALRSHDVTASVAGCLLGVHNYQTVFGLYALKSGIVTDDVEETPAMTRGLLLEPVALKLIRQQRPEWTIKWNGEPGELSGCYWRDPEFRLGATPDCLVVDEKGRKGVVQVKSVERSIFRKNWFGADDGSDEYDPGEITPPLWIVVQALIECALTGSEFAAVAPMVIGYGLDLHIIEIPIHAGIIDRVRAASLEFWQRVAEGRPPDPDYARDGSVIAKLYADANGLEVDLSTDNLLPAICDERETLLVQRNATQKRLDEIKAELAHKLGSNTVGYASGWQISNKLQTRKEYTAPATSFRVLRTKRLR